MAVYFWTVYSLGLRMEEGLNLQIGDVDAKRMMVHVHRGKGAKDRYIPLPSVDARPAAEVLENPSPHTVPLPRRRTQSSRCLHRRRLP